MSLIKELLQHFDEAAIALKASPVVEPALADVQTCVHELEAIYEEAEKATAVAVDAAERKAGAWLTARFGHLTAPLAAVNLPESAYLPAAETLPPAVG